MVNTQTQLANLNSCNIQINYILLVYFIEIIQKGEKMNAIFFYALLALGLLLDGAFLFRLVLFSVFIHESAHVIIYMILAKKMVKLQFSAGGICLKRTENLNTNKKLLVLLAGPFSNLIVSLTFYILAQREASYFSYIFCAVNLCVGLYNLLPVNPLDGAQIIECFLPPGAIFRWVKFQKAIIILISATAPGLALLVNASPTATVAAFIAPLYLLFQNTLK